jgi:hypothetical protein
MAIDITFLFPHVSDVIHLLRCDKTAEGSHRRGTNYRFTPSVFDKGRRRVVQRHGAESISLP